MIIVLLIVVLIIFVFVYEIKHAGNVCGSCSNYHNCYGHSFARDDYECPACKNFKEREE